MFKLRKNQHYFKISSYSGAIFSKLHATANTIPSFDTSTAKNTHFSLPTPNHPSIQATTQTNTFICSIHHARFEAINTRMRPLTYTYTPNHTWISYKTAPSRRRRPHAHPHHPRPSSSSTTTHKVTHLGVVSQQRANKPSAINPFWNEFRRQIGRLEGLQAIRLPSSLQLATNSDRHLTVRCGAFHSDRLRYGRYILIVRDDKHVADTNNTNDDDVDMLDTKTKKKTGPRRRHPHRHRHPTSDHHPHFILLGALHPTIYSSHPSLMFQVAIRQNHWVVGWDFDAVALSLPSPPLSKLITRIQEIKNDYNHIAVDIAEDSPYISSCGGILSSDVITSTSTSTDVLQEAQSAFRSILSTHLDCLVLSPLDNTPSAVVSASTRQAALAAQLSLQSSFLGAEMLESSFGDVWMHQLRQYVLNDRQGCLSNAEIEKLLGTGGGGDVDDVAGDEFIYFDPRLLDVEE